MLNDLKEKFEKLETPEELMDFLATYITYGWYGKDGNLRIDTIAEFSAQYQLSSLSEVLESGKGVCFEEIELAREFFVRKKIPFQTYIIQGRRVAHAILIYQEGKWFHQIRYLSPKNFGAVSAYNVEVLLQDEVTGFMNEYKIKELDKVKLVSYGKLPDRADAATIKQIILEKENLIPEAFQERLFADQPTMGLK